MNKRKSSHRITSNTIYILKKAYHTSPSRLFIDIVTALCEASQSVYLSVFFIRYLMNGIETQRAFEDMLHFFIISGSFFAVTFLISAWYENRYVPVSNQKIRESIGLALFTKAASVDLACYEDTEFYDSYTKSIQNINQMLEQELAMVRGLVSGGIAVFGFAAYLTGMDAGMCVIAMIPVAALLVLGNLLNHGTYALENANITLERQKEYVDRVFYQADHAMDLRMTELEDCLLQKSSAASEGILKNVKIYGLKNSALYVLLRCFTWIFPLIVGGIYVSWLVLVKKRAGIGDLAVMALAITNLSGNVQNLVRQVLKLGEMDLYFGNIKKFLSYKPIISEEQEGEALHLREGEVPQIEFDHVWFSYSPQEEPCLRDISFVIKPGEMVLLAGFNGAGKTTLIKLLLRLYDPTKGRILVNGRDIKEYSLKEYRAVFSILFQDYQIYAMSMGENISMSEAELELSNLVHAEKQSGFEAVAGIGDRKKLYEGTVLTKEFCKEGRVLSGGEAQKLAAARMYYRNAPVAVLDEPASALDPISEKKLYENLRAAGKKKTILLVSHNLSAAVYTDRVLMLEKGVLVQSGPQKELSEQDGLYRRLFSMQAESYAGEVASGEK